MAGLRKGHCYTPVERAYTRKSKYKTKAFIKSVPQNKVVRYNMGNKDKPYTYRLDLVSQQPIQLRHNAIEASRQVVNRHLEADIGTSNYFFNIRLYPHHVLRENKMITGAGADRMQTGMQRAFGAAIGLAARVRKNQPIFTVKTDKAFLEQAKGALKRSIPRLPGSYVIAIKEIKE